MSFSNFRAGFIRGRTLPLIVRLGLAVAAAVGAALPTPARAEDKSIGIELNRLQAVDGACRISLVFTNGLSVAVEALSIETVLFNKEGAVERFLVLKSNPLPSGKVRVQQFDAKGLACDGVGRVLLNDVKECKIEGISPQDCLDVIKPSSRTGADFFSSTVSSAGKNKQ